MPLFWLVPWVLCASIWLHLHSACLSSNWHSRSSTQKSQACYCQREDQTWLRIVYIHLALTFALCWRRKWQPTLAFLPRESLGRRNRWATGHGRDWSDSARVLYCLCFVMVALCLCWRMLPEACNTQKSPFSRLWPLKAYCFSIIIETESCRTGHNLCLVGGLEE